MTGSQAVIFLARGEDGGWPAAEAFFASYRAHPAGLPHDLIIIAKGWDGVPGREMLEQQAQELAAQLVELPDDGMDWGAYMRLTPSLTRDWLCFLNTHSRIRTDGWLAALRRAAELPGVGAAGATGCWGSFTPKLKALGSELADLAGRRGWLRTAFSAGNFLLSYPFLVPIGARSFPPFPNFYLRSNAFVIRRPLFAAYIAGQPIPRSKRDCHMLESGRFGLSRFLVAQGLSLVVVGRDGKSYPPEAWTASGTFRVPGQDNLLIEDNQTIGYGAAPRHTRRIMERWAWGRNFTA